MCVLQNLKDFDGGNELFELVYIVHYDGPPISVLNLLYHSVLVGCSAHALTRSLGLYGQEHPVVAADDVRDADLPHAVGHRHEEPSTDALEVFLASVFDLAFWCTSHSFSR
jgi:hypothetical protein